MTEGLGVALAVDALSRRCDDLERSLAEAKALNTKKPTRLVETEALQAEWDEQVFQSRENPEFEVDEMVLAGDDLVARLRGKLETAEADRDTLRAKLEVILKAWDEIAEDYYATGRFEGIEKQTFGPEDALELCRGAIRAALASTGQTEPQ